MSIFKLDQEIFSRRINELKNASDEFAKAKGAFERMDIGEVWTALNEVNKFSGPLVQTMKVIDGELANISRHYTEVISHLQHALEEFIGEDRSQSKVYADYLGLLAQASQPFSYRTPSFMSKIGLNPTKQSLAESEGSASAEDNRVARENSKETTQKANEAQERAKAQEAEGEN